MSTCNLRIFRAKPRQSRQFIANQKQNLIYVLVKLSAIIALPPKKRKKSAARSREQLPEKTLTIKWSGL